MIIWLSYGVISEIQVLIPPPKMQIKRSYIFRVVTNQVETGVCYHLTKIYFSSCSCTFLCYRRIFNPLYKPNVSDFLGYYKFLFVCFCVLKVALFNATRASLKHIFLLLLSVSYVLPWFGIICPSRIWVRSIEYPLFSKPQNNNLKEY